MKRDSYKIIWSWLYWHSLRNPSNDTAFVTRLPVRIGYASIAQPRSKQIFQNLVGILRWLTWIGRVDILYEDSSLPDALARHIFKYLEMHVKNELLFVPLCWNLFVQDILIGYKKKIDYRRNSQIIQSDCLFAYFFQRKIFAGSRQISYDVSKKYSVRRSCNTLNSLIYWHWSQGKT